MADRDVSAPYVDTGRSGRPDRHRAEDEPDLEGYDESQRAEIAEAEVGGPGDGVMLTDLDPDTGGDIDEDEIEDEADDLIEERSGGF